MKLTTLMQLGLLIDEEDIHLILESNSWYIEKSNGYVRSRDVNGKTLYLHKVLLPTTDPSLEVDHINRNKLDNRKANLRLVSRQDNSLNKNKKSGLPRGVYFHKPTKKYYSQITKKGFRYTIGYFKTIEEASEAYEKEKVL